MNAKDDLILGVLANYHYKDIEAYAVSISHCGFRGRKVLLVWNIDQYTRDRLTDHGFELIDVAPANKTVTFASQFFKHRDRVAYEFLKEHAGEFRCVFWLDIRDLVVQTDPSEWVELHLGSKRIVIASESVRIKDEPCNDTWLKNIFTPETYLRIREYDVLNAGTIAGDAEAMTSLFDYVSKISEWTGEITEQAAMNVMLREPEFADIVHVPEMSEGFALVGLGCNPGHAVYCWGQQQPECRDGIFYPRGSRVPFSIVHQFDRNPEWKNVIEKKYHAYTSNPRADG